MKVVILAGGLGTRISEYTKTIPKPMIKVCGKPIIHRIIDHFYFYGHKEFYITLGYKGDVIKKYFKNCKLKKGVKIFCVNTGKKTMTGGRIKRLSKHLKSEFLLTYGDGLSDVNINNLIKFHKKNKKLATLTAVRPPARFGKIKLNNQNEVILFREKSSLDVGWINGGYFVLNPHILSLIKDDKTYFEKEPLEKLSKKGQLMAFKHSKTWQCMDTARDKLIIENLLKTKKLKF